MQWLKSSSQWVLWLPFSWVSPFPTSHQSSISQKAAQLLPQITTGEYYSPYQLHLVYSNPLCFWLCSTTTHQSSWSKTTNMRNLTNWWARFMRATEFKRESMLLSLKLASHHHLHMDKLFATRDIDMQLSLDAPWVYCNNYLVLMLSCSTQVKSLLRWELMPVLVQVLLVSLTWFQLSVLFSS